MPEVFDPNVLVPLGVGGILAYLIFLGYRQREKDEIDRWRGLTEAISTERGVLIQVVKDNTAALQSQTEVARALHKRLDTERDQQATINGLQAVVAALERRLGEGASQHYPSNR